MKNDKNIVVLLPFSDSQKQALEAMAPGCRFSYPDRQALTHRRYVNLRGEVLPFVRLRDHFEIGGNPGRRENIVVVQYGGQKAGVVVDRLMGEFQTVIKPLGRLFSNLLGIGGSTILGSGEVALILDVAALVNLVARGEEERRHTNKQSASFAALADNSLAVQLGR